MEVDWPDAEDMAREQVEWWQANGFTIDEALAALGIDGDPAGVTWWGLVYLAAHKLVSTPPDGLNLEQYRLKK